MDEVRKDNLNRSFRNLARFIIVTVDTLKLHDADTISWLSRRLVALGTVAQVVDEIFGRLERSGDGKHEFRLNDADLKFFLELHPDGTVDGYVSHEYPNTKAVCSGLNSLLNHYCLERE